MSKYFNNFSARMAKKSCQLRERSFLLGLRSVLELSLMGKNGWKEAKEKLYKYHSEFCTNYKSHKRMEINNLEKSNVAASLVYFLVKAQIICLQKKQSN